MTALWVLHDAAVLWGGGVREIVVHWWMVLGTVLAAVIALVARR